MKYQTFFWTALLLSLHIHVTGQVTVHEEPSNKVSRLNTILSRLSKDTLSFDWMSFNDEVQSSLTTILKDTSIHSNDLDSLKNILITWSLDSSIQVFTWQFRSWNEQYSYGGCIHVIKPKSKMLRLTELVPELNSEFQEAELSLDSWPGGLVYKVVPFKNAGRKKYLILSYHGFNGVERMKMIDVWDIHPKGQVVLGCPVFRDTTQSIAGRPKRFFFTYSSEVAMRCNYEEEYAAVIYDHLIPMSSPTRPEVGPLPVPDGSFEGWVYNALDGLWYYRPMMFTTVSDTPPMSEEAKARSSDSSKDLFGRERPPKKKK